MNTPNNKRRRESRDRIERVFIEMLQTEELDKIKVSDICKKAGVNRTTFYANYNDIYELADSLCTGLEAQLGEIYQDEISRKTIATISKSCSSTFKAIRFFIIPILSWALTRIIRSLNMITNWRRSILETNTLNTTANFSRPP